MATHPTDAPTDPTTAPLLARVRTQIRGLGDKWFGPLQPRIPNVPEGNDRVLDYPVGWNLSIQPRQGCEIGFTHLRSLADKHDLLRLVIETRKDQMARLDWEIRDRKTRLSVPDAAPIMDFFQSPDKEHDWPTWVRQVLEEMFVIDATSVVPRYTKSGDLYSLEQYDGSTITRLLDGKGRTPVPPDPAYQQVIKGNVMANFSRDELLYRPRNPRVNKVYGFSHVEQIIMTVMIALRRQLYQLQYYTEGNIPEALSQVPETWSLDQIKAYQIYWDTMLEGDTAQKRHMKFIPHGVSYIPTKEPKLHDEHDEWLARIICYTFSIPPTPFIKQMNRATAETAGTSALEEGQEPVKKWFCSFMNMLLWRYFKRPDLEFVWKFETSVDRKKQAEIHQIYVVASVMTINEARAEIGLPSLGPDGDKLMRTFEAENQIKMKSQFPERNREDPTNSDNA